MTEATNNLNRAKWVWRQGRRYVSEAIDPSPIALDRRVAGLQSPPVDLICVYRCRNASTVIRLIRSLGNQMHSANLWALDAPNDDLADYTVGSGSGTRLTLLNQLEARTRRTAEERWLIVADDDVILPRRRMDRFRKAANASRLDISQPAHAARSKASWEFNRRRAGTLLRRTSFVEAGPLVLFSLLGRRTCFPLDEELGMGWGLEIAWSNARRAGLELGIVDAAPMIHLGPVARDYDRPTQEAQARAILSTHGLSGFSDLHVVHESWRLGSALRFPAS